MLNLFSKGWSVWIDCGFRIAAFVAFILHKRVNSTFMRAINWVFGGIILIFGLTALSILI